MRRSALVLIGLAVAAEAACDNHLDLRRPLVPPARASAVAGLGSATISWSPTVGAARYVVVWSTGADPTLQSNLGMITTSTGTTAQVGGLTPGVTWRFAIAAERLEEQALSASVPVVPLDPATWFEAAPFWSAAGAAGASFGSAIALGDVDGNARPDLLVGSPGTAKGTIDLFLGTTTAFTASPVWSMNGESAGDALGSSIALLDANGDGNDDIAAGAPHVDVTVLVIGLQPDAGRAYLWLGSSPVPASTPAWTFDGSATNAHLGFAMSPVPPQNGSRENLAVGEPRTGGGIVHLFQGQSDGLSAQPVWTPAASPAELGYSIASAGDLDHDGKADVVAGAPGEGAGTVHPFLGAAGNPPFSEPAATAGPAGSSRFGSGVAGVGDVTGDGVDDLAVVSIPAAAPSALFLHPGGTGGLSPSPIWTTTMQGIATGSGIDVAPSIDVDGDGIQDLVVGKPLDAGGAGSVQLWLGAVGGPGAAPVWSLDGAAAGDHLGSRVLARDLDGDGVVDLVASATGVGGAGAVSAWHGIARAGISADAGPGPSAAVEQSWSPAGAKIVDPVTGRSYLCAWDFGAGPEAPIACTPADVDTVTHVFHQAGTFLVRLTVTDPRDGRTGSAFTTVVVAGP